MCWDHPLPEGTALGNLLLLLEGLSPWIHAPGWKAVHLYNIK